MVSATMPDRAAAAMRTPDGDGVCDYYGEGGCGRGAGFVDEDGDGVCDFGGGTRPMDGTGYRRCGRNR